MAVAAGTGVEAAGTAAVGAEAGMAEAAGAVVGDMVAAVADTAKSSAGDFNGICPSRKADSVFLWVFRS
jgi:hypothetical protein